MTFRIFLTIFIAIIAIAIGLLLRRLLVRRLKKTVLDNWLVQTLGIIVVLPSVILAVVATPFALDNSNILLAKALTVFQMHITDVTGVVWGFIQSLLIIV